MVGEIEVPGLFRAKNSPNLVFTPFRLHTGARRYPSERCKEITPPGCTLLAVIGSLARMSLT